MVELAVRYAGGKKCVATHPDGSTLTTDVPKDLGGDEDGFSPTDLVAAGLAACILTTVALFAERRGLDLRGMGAQVAKEMSPGHRRILRLAVTVTLPAALNDTMRATLERIARTCPVHAGLHPDIDAPIDFRYE